MRTWFRDALRGPWPFLILSLCLGLYRLDSRSLWQDEAISAGYATVDWGRFWLGLADDRYNMVLYMTTLRGVSVLSTSEWALRTVSVLAGAGTILPLWYISRDEVNVRAARVACSFLATSFVWVRYQQEARPYALLTLVVALAMWAAARYRVSGKTWLGVAWGFAAVCAMYIQIVSVFPLFVQALWILRWRKDRQTLAVVGVAGAASLPIVLAAASGTNDNVGWLPSLTPAFLAELGAFQLGLLSVRDSRVLSLIAAAVVVVSVIATLLAPKLERPLPLRRRQLMVFAVWGLLPLTLMLLVSLVNPLTNTRYFLPVFPASAYLLGVLLSMWKRPWYSLTLSLMVALNLSRTFSGYGKEDVDWREVVNEIDTRATNGDRVAFAAPYGQAPFEYHYGRMTTRTRLQGLGERSQFGAPYHPYPSEYPPSVAAGIDGATIWFVDGDPNNSGEVEEFATLFDDVSVVRVPGDFGAVDIYHLEESHE